MCLAVPLQLVEINGFDGVGEYGGVRRNVRLDFIENPQLGEYVMVHAGFAIERLSKEQAKEDIKAWQELEEALKQ